MDPQELMIPLSDVIAEVSLELDSAIEKFPTWPTRAIDAAMVVQEEAGELAKAALQCTYEPHKCQREEMAREAIQTAAVALRFLQSICVYDFTPGEQHEQG